MQKRSKTAKFKDIMHFWKYVENQKWVQPWKLNQIVVKTSSWKHRLCWPEEKPLGSNLGKSQRFHPETLPRFFHFWNTPGEIPKATFYLRNGGRPRNLCALWERSSQRSWSPGRQLNVKCLLIAGFFRENREKGSETSLEFIFLLLNIWKNKDFEI